MEQHREHLAEQLSQHSLVVQAQKILQEFHENEALESWSHVGPGEPTGEESLLGDEAPAASSHVGARELWEGTGHNGELLENSSHVGTGESSGEEHERHQGKVAI